jgi:flagellar basal-body rod protein FlgB
MEFERMSLFGAVKKRLSWLTQRQEILAQNIANSDTPKYAPSDLKRYSFDELVRSENMQLNLDANGPGLIAGRPKRIRDYATVTERRPYETSPNGNSVVLEEQMAKVNETSIDHKFMTKIYKKNLDMIRMAIGNK